MSDDRTKHFKIRLTPEVHRLVRLAAADEEKSMQDYLEEMIKANVKDQYSDR